MDRVQSHVQVLPQVQEQDINSGFGQQKEDVNSLVELFNVEMGYDKTPDDEDNDSGQNFHLVKFVDYSFQQIQTVLQRYEHVSVKKHEFSEYRMPVLESVCIEIPTPPPDLS